MKRFVSLLALATAQAAAAQAVPTDIRPDVDPAKSLGTTVTAAGRVRTIDGGRLSGPNLFHSFSKFDLGAGDVARWQHSGGDPSKIGNVVNRVTGGTASSMMLSWMFAVVTSTEHTRPVPSSVATTRPSGRSGRWLWDAKTFCSSARTRAGRRWRMR